MGSVRCSSLGPGRSCGVLLRRIVSREEFDDATILLLLEGGAKHLLVFSEVVGLVLGATGSGFALDYGDFCGEVPVIGWVFANRVDVVLSCFGVFVITECSVDCFFPRESE